VRAAALERLAELRGAAAADVLALALADPEPPVRAAAVQGLGALGDAAVPELRRALDGSDPVAARSALAALSISPGAQARALLVEIADSHEDADLQRLAALALGRAPEDH
jgi:HEAT repeat protein